MKIAILIVITIAIVAELIFVIFNRDSEKLLNAVIPIAAASVAALIIVTFVFSDASARSEVLPVSFFVYRDTLMPEQEATMLGNRFFSDATFAPAALHKQHPEYFQTTGPDGAIPLYHHLLQMAIIDWLSFWYRGAWQVEIEKFSLASSTEGRVAPAVGTETSKRITYSDQQITQLMNGNIFASIRTGFPPQVTFPVGTRMRIVPPKTTTAEPQTAYIYIEKPHYFNVTIRTEYRGMSMGMGSYQLLLGLPDDENQKLMNVKYTIRINVEFNRWLSGSPETKQYRAWADQLIEGLKDQFDEQETWSRAKENYLFRKQIEHFGPLQFSTRQNK